MADEGQTPEIQSDAQAREVLAELHRLTAAFADENDKEEKGKATSAEMLHKLDERLAASEKALQDFRATSGALGTSDKDESGPEEPKNYLPRLVRMQAFPNTPEARKDMAEFGDFHTKMQERRLKTEDGVIEDITNWYAVPQQTEKTMIDQLRAVSLIDKMVGLRKYTPKASPLKLPRLLTSALPAMMTTGDNTQEIAADTQALDEVEMTPKKAAGIIPISNDLIRDADVSIQQILTQDLVENLALLIDGQWLDGTGTAPQVQGILDAGYTVIHAAKIDLSSTAVDFDDILQAEYVVMNGNAAPSSWAMAPRELFRLRTLKDGNGRYVMLPSMEATDPPTLHGVPYFVSSVVGNATYCTQTQNAVVTGDFNYAAKAEWGGLMLEASREASYNDGTNLQSAFTRDQTLVRLQMRFDFAILREAAFCAIIGTA